jgi:hypothetical protein
MDRHARLGCAQFADLQRHLVHPLGDADRRAGAGAVPFQGDGEMRRVDDDHVGLGHVDQHLVGGDLLRPLAPGLLHVGVALGLLEFLAQLLVAHPLAAQVVVALPEEVDRPDQRHDERRR